MVTENEAQVYQAYIYLPPHPDGARMIREIALTLREAYEAVALEALAELCERHSVQLEDAPAAFLPIHYQADQPWRFRRLQMLEHQQHIAAHLARYGRDLENNWQPLQSMPSTFLTCRSTRNWKFSASNIKW